MKASRNFRFYFIPIFIIPIFISIFFLLLLMLLISFRKNIFPNHRKYWNGILNIHVAWQQTSSSSLKTELAAVWIHIRAGVLVEWGSGMRRRFLITLSEEMCENKLLIPWILNEFPWMISAFSYFFFFLHFASFFLYILLTSISHSQNTLCANKNHPFS